MNKQPVILQLLLTIATTWIVVIAILIWICMAFRGFHSVDKNHSHHSFIQDSQIELKMSNI